MIWTKTHPNLWASFIANLMVELAYPGFPCVQLVWHVFHQVRSHVRWHERVHLCQQHVSVCYTDWWAPPFYLMKELFITPSSVLPRNCRVCRCYFCEFALFLSRTGHENIITSIFSSWTVMLICAALHLLFLPLFLILSPYHLKYVNVSM